VQQGSATGDIASFQFGSTTPNDGTEVMGIDHTGVNINESLTLGTDDTAGGEIFRVVGDVLTEGKNTFLHDNLFEGLSVKRNSPTGASGMLFENLTNTLGSVDFRENDYMYIGIGGDASLNINQALVFNGGAFNYNTNFNISGVQSLKPFIYNDYPSDVNINGTISLTDGVASDEAMTRSGIESLPVSTFTNDVPYLTSYTETDPVYTASSWFSTTNNSTDWNLNTSSRHNAVTLGTANGLTLSTQQLSLGLSSTSSTGSLSDTDWDIFNNKLDLADISGKWNNDGSSTATGNWDISITLILIQDSQKVQEVEHTCD